MLIIKLKNFAKALFWHIYFGFPKTLKKDLEHRYSLCKSCDKYDDNQSKCTVCWCNISDRSEFFNKLAWADQECPIGKWQKLKGNDNAKPKK